MLARNTVFVVGAGASAEVKIPVGSALKENIKDILNFRFEYGHSTSGDSLTLDALKIETDFYSGEAELLNHYIRSGHKFVDAVKEVSSIDSFVDAHADDDKLAFCAKLAIVRAILMAESKSLFFHQSQRQRKLDISSFREKDVWLPRFFSLLSEGIRTGTIDEIFQNLTIICFNYDRCIEEYLYRIIQTYFAISKEASALILSRLNIIHPYGIIGRLPWQSGASQAIAFGGDINANDLLNASRSIRTFGERMDDTATLDQIRFAMDGCEKVVFLGFGYHQQNMSLIQASGGCIPKDVMATSHGFSDLEKPAIVRAVERSISGRMLSSQVMQTGCSNFFDIFPLSLRE